MSKIEIEYNDFLQMVSINDEYIASIHSDGYLRIINAFDGNLLKSIKCHENSI